MKQVYALSFLCFLLFSNHAFSQSTIKYRDALDFDGFDDRVTIEPDNAFDFSEGTVEAWVQPELLSGANMIILGNRGETDTRYSIHMNANSVGLWNGGSYLTVYLSTPFRVGAWYHVAAAIGEYTTDFYVDGEFVGSTENGMGSATGLPVEIGNTNDYNALLETYNGIIDEVKFWNVIRTAEEIKSDMYDTTTTNSSLVAYYKLNEASGTEAADATGNGRNGVLYNFALTGERSNWVSNYIIGAPVAVDATLISSGSFTANWEAPVGDTVTNYLLDVAYDEYFTNPLPGYVGLNVGDTVAYTIGGLEYSQTYYYRVRAVKDGISNKGPYSNTVSVTTLKRVGGKLFVNAGAAESMNNGTSWNDAYLLLEDALNTAKDGDTIWVAKGTYQPKENQWYSLVKGVKVFGGFAGTETVFEERVLAKGNASILKGNNSHVFVNNNLDMDTELDGFTISDGYHQSTGEDDNYFNGGGMYNTNSSFIIKNCTFTNNKAGLDDSPAGNYSGGAVYNEFSSPLLVNCAFEGNNARGEGGAIFNVLSIPVIKNSVFFNNYSAGAGGAIANRASSGNYISGSLFYGNLSQSNKGNLLSTENSLVNMTNCTITGNYDPASLPAKLIDNNSEGGGWTNIGNSIISHNGSESADDHVTISYSMTDFSAEGEGNIMSPDPMFIQVTNPAGGDGIWGTADDGLQLQTDSKAINTGSNALVSVDISTDLLGNSRIVDATVDMGCYEYTGSLLPVTLASFKAVSNGCAVQINWKAAQETGVDKYTIEKSIDGIHFALVADVKAKNVSGATYAYTYNSNNESTLYFRLKITDKNGKTDYSAIERVMLSCQQPNITMTPNPVKNILLVTNLSGTNQIQVYNTSGQQVVSLKTSNSRQPVDVASLPNGVYVVRVMNNNKVLITQKIMKY